MPSASRVAAWTLLAAGAILFAPAPAFAQDSTALRVDTVRVDSLGPRPPISPSGALFRSFLIPGWGQAKLNRKLTGGLFVAWEGVTLGMALKASHELGYLRRTHSGRVETKKAERQDWIVLLAFNHLLSGLEAYVSAHLWDFPEDLKLRAVPGGFGGQINLPRLR